MMYDSQDHIPFLAGATEGLRQLMRSLATDVDLPKGETLMSQGEDGDTLYIVRAGLLEVSVLSSEGRKLSLNVAKRGEVLGEIALFDPGPRTATVVAREACKLWAIRNADLMDALRNSPDLAIEIAQLAGQRMRWISGQLTEQVFLPLPARLARKILHLTAHDPDPHPLLEISQSELADFAGASREAVSKTLAIWAREGHLTLTRGAVRVRNPSALNALADFTIL